MANRYFKMKTKILSIQSRAQKFADITKALIINGNIRRAKKCLLVAEKLMQAGNNETKNAIANVYVFSVSTFMEMHNCSIANLFPASLRSEYLKQVNTSGV
jgi:hypothetical protein